MKRDKFFVWWIVISLVVLVGSLVVYSVQQRTLPEYSSAPEHEPLPFSVFLNEVQENNPGIEREQAMLLAAMNQVREQHNLEPLSWDSKSHRNAQRYADAQLRGNQDPYSGDLSRDILGRPHYGSYRHAYIMFDDAEILVYSHANPLAEKGAREVIESWVESPTHAAQMLSPDMGKVGFGVAEKRVGDSESGARYFVARLNG